MRMCSRPLVREDKPPKLGGWGSEQPNSMYNTDNVLPLSVLYITLFSLLSHEGSNGIHALLPQCVPLFRPPAP